MTKRSALALLITTVLFPAALAVTGFAALPAAVPGRPVLVIGWPFGSPAARIVAQAGGWPVSPGDPPVGQIAHSGHPGFLAALRAGGAMMLLDATRLSSLICGANA